MKIATVFVCLLVLAVSPAFSATVTYRMSIDGDYSTTQPRLAVGVHLLEVEVLVTDNDLVPGTGGGLFQSAFDLNTDNGGFTFLDQPAGFIVGPDGRWDSQPQIPPFDFHFQGITAIGGGPTVIEETSAIHPTEFTIKFDAVGVDGYTRVARGQFDYGGGQHPEVLNLVAVDPLAFGILVAGLDGTTVVAKLPTAVNNATIVFVPEPAARSLVGVALAATILGSLRRRGSSSARLNAIFSGVGKG